MRASGDTTAARDGTGVAASSVQLPAGDWATVLDCLCDRFPGIAREQWRDRMARGRVTDVEGRVLDAEHPYRNGLVVRYFREVMDERPIPFEEVVLHVDDDLLVADKPHFLPVAPVGGHVEHTLLARLVRRFDNSDLVPLHRIDRATAGLVLFSTRRQTRAQYHALFRERRIDKGYLAIAPALPELRFPLVRHSRLERGTPFFRMQEVEGVPNAETRIDVQQREGALWRYALQPLTGRKHQLRVHMAALGAGIVGDELYPELTTTDTEDRHRFGHPLQLLAHSLAFEDPLTGQRRHFTTTRTLEIP
ncbi:MAG: pseudouridine synthase [Luteimonas sp.]|nr:pseudouridine synthase [Luteimonas sp.]